jgi:hypothetical protein
MGQVFTGNQFYKGMGVLLLALVITGFGSAAIVRGQTPFELPMLYHLHGISYLIWFSFFIFQASLIGKDKRQLHMTIGKISPVVILAMLVTGWMMARMSFERGVSPIPDISIQQFTAFPFFDLLGLLVFYVLAIVKRTDAEFHKRAMLLGLIAIMDPATARIGLSIGFPPFPLIASLLLLGAVIWHDRKVLNRVHLLTWFGLLWVFLRLGFVFGFATTEIWVQIASTLFS